jgi:hypothetical protein
VVVIVVVIVVVVVVVVVVLNLNFPMRIAVMTQRTVFMMKSRYLITLLNMI